MQNCALEFISGTRHFTASSALRANQHTKLNRAMLFTQQIFASECEVASLPYLSKLYIGKYSKVND